MSPQLDETMAVYAGEELRHSDVCPVCLNGGHCLEAIQAEWEGRQIPTEPEPLEDGMPF